MPSRPVFAPTYRTGLPTPAALPKKIWSWRTRPSAHALTDRKSTRLNSTHALHDALPIYAVAPRLRADVQNRVADARGLAEENLVVAYEAERECVDRSEEHTAELHSRLTRRSSDLCRRAPSSRRRTEPGCRRPRPCRRKSGRGVRGRARMR